jgi:hypothetical protein
MAQYDDNYMRAARARAAEIDSELAQIDAGMARANSDDDQYALREMIGGRSVLRSERLALERDYNEYVKARTTPPTPLTDEERRTMSWDKCLQDQQGTLDFMLSKSKYWSGPQDWNNPDVVKRVNEGFTVLRDRQRSKEYHG